jgi:hypothetical protein
MATIVSCYYLLNKSKHSPSEYKVWIDNFILNLKKVNLIIFTSIKSKKFIQQILEQNKLIQFKIIEKEIDDFKVSKDYKDIWDDQFKKDPDPVCGRGIDCYKIWNNKFSFLKEAIESNPFNSEKFIWNDIGNVRNSNVFKFLNNYPLEKNISNDKVDIVLISPFTNNNQLLFQNEIHFSGSMFGGHKDILLELEKLYYIYFEIYFKKDLFIGCDQQIISTLYLKNKNKFNSIIPHNSSIDEWFYLYQYYSV